MNPPEACKYREGGGLKVEADTIDNNIDRFLSVDEVAALLNVSRSSIFAWAKAKVIPPQRKFGRASRWSLTELTAYINSVPKGAYGEGGGS